MIDGVWTQVLYRVGSFESICHKISVCKWVISGDQNTDVFVRQYETAGHLNACRHRGMQCKKLQDDDETGGSGHDLGDRPVINLGLS